MREIQYRHESGSLPPSLEKVPFLRGLDAAVSESLIADSVLLECDPGDMVIEEGDDSKFFCILLKGAMDVVKAGKKITRFSDPGEMLGELALVNDSTRSASVVAVTHSFCLKVEPEFLDGLSDAERNGFFAQLYQFVTRILGDRLEESSKRIVQLETRVQELSGGTAGDPASDADDAPGVYRL
jgi:CRP/FNR family cyclic AMP-dependent transcriptional regulator